jgi:hypothetical protein
MLGARYILGGGRVDCDPAKGAQHRGEINLIGRSPSDWVVHDLGMECYPHGVGIVEGPCRSLLHTTRPSQRTYNATICFLIDLRYFGWLHMFPYSPSKGALCQEPGKQQTSNYVCCQVVPWTLNCTIHLMYLPWLFGPGHKLTHNRMCKTLSKHVSTPQPQPPNTIPLGGPPLPCSGAPREAKLGYWRGSGKRLIIINSSSSSSSLN